MLTSIRTALAVMFAVLAVVTGLQGVVSYQELAELEADMTSVAGHDVPALGAIREISGAVLRVRSKQFRLVLTEPISQVIDNNTAELRRDQDELRDARIAYDALIASEPERKVFTQVSSTLDTYARLTAALPTLMQAGKAEQAQQLLLQPWLRVLSRSADDQLNNAIRLIQNQASALTRASVAALAHARLVALASAVAAACLAAIAIAISYVRIVKPLGNVTRVLDQLAAGNVAADQVLSRRQDEIGAIGRAVEVFRTSLIRMRQAEAERLETQLLVQNIAASTPDGIVAFDGAGLVTFWNRAAEELLGLKADDVLGRHVDLALPTGSSLPADDVRWSTGRNGTTIEAELQHRHGHMIPVELSYSRWEQDGRIMSCAILRDIRGRKRDQAVLNRLAHTDTLTGLPNRLVLTSRMATALAAGRHFALLMLDLDHFKQVNDMFGHQTGDKVLKIAAQRLLECLQSDDMATRIGGDEFIIMLDGHADPLQVARVADRMVDSLGEPFTVEGRTIHLGASMGIALAPTHGNDPDELMTCADLALYAVKSQGRHGHRLFTPELRAAAVRDSTVRQELPRAVERGEFRLFFQPQVRLADHALIGAEALIRWQHPELGLVGPDAFIPVLESSHLAEDVGDWVIETACLQAAAWRRTWPEFRVGVNLSGAHFRSGRIDTTVKRILQQCDLPGSALEVEITEHVILRHDERMIAPLRELQQLGVSIAFDDYGTGYASLSLLKRFPLNRLKIDRGFVRTMLDSPEDAAIVRTILALGSSLNLDVIAEGVETEAQASRLRGNGCVEAQGYLFGRPMPAETFTARFQPTPSMEKRAG